MNHTYEQLEVQILNGNFSDLPEGHWAQSAVGSAVNQGYVSGYPDGNFKPNAEVTRAEFISMLVRAIGLEIGESDIWYEPFVQAAQQAGILQDEYTEYGQKMNRSEMATASVRALGEEVENANDAMLRAVELGLITGVDSEGNLDMWGTTTRAQSVAIIQRVLRVQRGEKLNVDQNAYEKAKDQVDLGQGGEVEQEKDQFGWAIRTENLPSNYKDFPYILEGVPNEAYEMDMYNNGRPGDLTPYERWNNDRTGLKLAAQSEIDHGIAKVSNYFNTILNVDYRTIEDDWGKEFFDDIYFLKPEMREEAREGLPNFVKFIRDNKISIEGKFEAHPSMMYAQGGSPLLRSKITFKINEIGNLELLERDSNGRNKPGIIYYHRYDYNLFEIGKTYEFYSDVGLTHTAPLMGGGNWISYLTVNRDFGKIFNRYVITNEEW